MNEIVIRPIEGYQIKVAKEIILEVGRKLYGWAAELTEITHQFDKKGELEDIDNYQSHYFERRGTFLVAMENDQVVGLGAIRRIDDHICELKRLWLLEKYLGRRIGYRILHKLIEFAHENGYEKIWLETDHEQESATRFYQRVGFRNQEKYNQRNRDIYMEMEI